MAEGLCLARWASRRSAAKTSDWQRVTHSVHQACDEAIEDKKSPEPRQVTTLNSGNCPQAVLDSLLERQWACIRMEIHSVALANGLR
jgi:hypothetical protein